MNILALCLMMTSLVRQSPDGWQPQAYKFLTFQAPAGAQIQALPDPIPAEKQSYADFTVRMSLKNQPMSVHISAAYRTSSVLEGLPPRKMLGKTWAAVKTKSPILSQDEVLLNKSELRGQRMKQVTDKKVIWIVMAVDSKFLVTVMWSRPRGTETYVPESSDCSISTGRNSHRDANLLMENISHFPSTSFQNNPAQSA